MVATWCHAALHCHVIRDTSACSNLFYFNSPGVQGVLVFLVFSPVLDGIHDDLDGVCIGEQVNDLHGVLHNTDRHHLLPVIAPVHHQRVGQPDVHRRRCDNFSLTAQIRERICLVVYVFLDMSICQQQFVKRETDVLISFWR